MEKQYETEFALKAENLIKPSWTQEETDQLKYLISVGLTHKEIAKVTGRTKNQIAGKVRRLKISRARIVPEYKDLFWTPELETLFLTLYHTGVSHKIMAYKLKCTEYHIRRKIKLMNLPARESIVNLAKNKEKLTTDEEKNYIRKRIVEDRVRVKDLAKELGVHLITLSTKLYRMGISPQKIKSEEAKIKHKDDAPIGLPGVNRTTFPPGHPLTWGILFPDVNYQDIMTLSPSALRKRDDD